MHECLPRRVALRYRGEEGRGLPVMDRRGRIYALHAVLRRARYPVSTSRLCTELDCTPATLRRVVQQMRDEHNAPIESSRRDGGGYWYSEDERGRYELPGLWFSASELAALVACLELLRSVEPGVLEPLLEPLRERVRILLERQHSAAGDELHRIRILGMAARIDRPEIFRTVAQAVLERRCLTYWYHTRGRDEDSQRRVSPQRLTRYRDNWYLDAWDHGRSGLRTFSLDRIKAPHLLAEAAKDVPDATLDRVLGASYGIFAGPAKHTAVLRFTPECARWVADERWHPRQKGRFLADGSYELRIPYGDPRELVMDILKYGSDVAVQAPESLRREVATRLRAAAGIYA